MKESSIRSRNSRNICDALDTSDNQKRNGSSKGRILRVKQGYNPNSSSMGSVVFALPAALLGITAGFGVVSGIILSALMKDTDKNRSEKEQKPTNAQASESSAEPEGE